MNGALRTTLFVSVALLPAGCASWFSPFRVPGGKPPDLRFASRAELGILQGPLPLDVVFTIHPQIQLEPVPAPSGWWKRDPSQPPFDRLSAFRSLTRNVITEAFASAEEAAPGSHELLENLRRSLAGQEKLPGELPPLNAKVLVLVDFRPSLPARPDLAAQLSVKLYDISCKGYDRMTLFNPRLLVFEDFAEVAPVEDPSKFPGTIFLAWKEILERMRSSRRFQEYLKLGPKPVDESSPDGAILLGIIPAERIERTPDPRCHQWIEEEFLFPPPVPEEKRPGAPSPSTAAGAGAEGPTPPGPIFTGGELPGWEPEPSDRIGPPPIEDPPGPPCRGSGTSAPKSGGDAAGTGEGR